MAGPPADPYEGMSDRAVLELAARHLRREASLPPGSIERAIAGAAYDAAAAELARRLAAIITGSGR